MDKRSLIDTVSFGQIMRNRVIDRDKKMVLLARLTDSHLAEDKFHRTINCNGYGRVREYQRYSILFENAFGGSPVRPLLRGHPPVAKLRTQVFQVAACNWRCWYCFVDDDRLAGNPAVAKLFTADEIVEMYLNEADHPDVLDISGGEPSLAPELMLWIMEALERRGLRGKIWLWNDENFSNSYLFDVLTARDRRYMAAFPMHSRIGCFKGYDAESFVYNTGAFGDGFARQFDICAHLINEGFDIYAYVTFTGPRRANLAQSMADFVDRLQAIHPRFPLRTIPLKVFLFSASRERAAALTAHDRLEYQTDVFDAWSSELERRFDENERRTPYHEIRCS